MHLPTHDLVKIYEDIHYYHDTARVVQEALDGLARAKKALLRGCVDPSAVSPEPTVELVVTDENGPRVTSDAASEGASEQPNEEPSLPAASIACLSCASPIAVPCWYCVDCWGSRTSRTSRNF